MVESATWRRLMGARVSRRRALGAAVGLGAAAMGVTACGDDGGGQVDEVARQVEEQGGIPYAWQLPDETDQAVRGGVYRSVVAADITGGYDPYRTSSRAEVVVLAGTACETLLEYESGPGLDPNRPNRRLQGRLADEFEQPDDVTVVFHLRPNVHFHNVPPVNGRTMEIEDWRATLEYLQASPYQAPIQSAYNLSRTEFPGRDTMTIRGDTPYAPGLGLFATGIASFWLLPREAVEGRYDPATRIIGTNYLQLETHEPSIRFVWKRHERYWRAGRPFMDRWLYAIVPEYANRLAQFAARHIYLFQPQPQDVLQTLRDVPDAIIQRADFQGGVAFNWFGLRDLETSPWRDERVRQAMSMCIDRVALFRHFRNADELEAAGLPIKMRYNTHFGGLSYFWLDWQDGSLGEESKYFRYDVTEARRLMAGAGYPDGIDIDIYSSQGTVFGAQYQELADIFVDMLQRSGLFRVNRVVLPIAEFWSRIYQERAFRGATTPVPSPYGNDDNDAFLYAQFHSKAGGDFRGFPDPTLDDMILRQRREMDPDRRRELMYEIQRYLARKMYTITVFGAADGFYFRYPWLRNTAWPGWNQWLAPDTPSRDSL